MSEWLKDHAWKECVGETLPWVRIPLSPPLHSLRSFVAVRVVFRLARGSRARRDSARIPSSLLLHSLRSFVAVRVVFRSARGAHARRDSGRIRLSPPTFATRSLRSRVPLASQNKRC